MPQKKIALIYDRVNTSFGGAEKVLLALHDLFPEAPLFTSVHDKHTAMWANCFKVIPSFIQRIPTAKKNHRRFFWLMPLAFESFDLTEYDLIISVASAEAKGIITKPHQLHVCYLLTPTRYLYSHQNHYQNLIPPLPFFSWIAKKALQYLKWWDKAAASRPDVIIPISNLVARRTRKFYSRKTNPTIYPPVNPYLQKENQKNKKMRQSLSKKQYFLVVSRLVSYKRIDLAIRACQQNNVKLIIIGDGPEREKLEKLAQKTKQLITFLGNVPQGTVNAHFENCKAVILPGVEDFGITAVEALGFGKPVIIHKKSGAAEIVEHNKYGIHISNETISAVSSAIEKCSKTSFDPEKLKKRAREYSTKQFKDRFYHAIVHICKDFWPHNPERFV